MSMANVYTFIGLAASTHIAPGEVTIKVGRQCEAADWPRRGKHRGLCWRNVEVYLRNAVWCAEPASPYTMLKHHSSGVWRRVQGAPCGVGRRRRLLPEQALGAVGQLHPHRLVPLAQQRRRGQPLARRRLYVALHLHAHISNCIALFLLSWISLPAERPLTFSELLDSSMAMAWGPNFRLTPCMSGQRVAKDSSADSFDWEGAGKADLVRLTHAQHALLLELEAADEARGAAGDAHGAAVVNVELADDEVVDAAHHLQQRQPAQKSSAAT